MMKDIIPLMVCLAFFTSCGERTEHQKSHPPEQATSERTSRAGVVEEFDTFFFSFSSDPEFQLARIKFPLPYETWADESEIGGKIVEKRIAKGEWKHEPFFSNESYRPQIFDNFEGNLRDTDERLFQWTGVETGINVRYFFKREDGKWFLVRKENLGD